MVADTKPYKQMARAATRSYLTACLKVHGGDVGASCKAAGISQASMYRALGGSIVGRFCRSFEDWQADQDAVQKNELIALRQGVIDMQRVLEERGPIVKAETWQAVRDVLTAHHGEKFVA